MSNEEVEEKEEVEESTDKKKRVIRRRQSKKDKENPVPAAIRLTVESGKVDFGHRSAFRNCESKNTKMFVLASNTPKPITSELEKNNKLSIPFFNYEGTSVELGSICGKPYPVTVLSVFDFGTSDLKKLHTKK